MNHRVCGHDTISILTRHNAFGEKNGEDFSCYSNKIESVSLRKCPRYDHRLTNKAYLSAVAVTNISRRFTYKMATKINWHRYGTKNYAAITVCVLRARRRTDDDVAHTVCPCLVTVGCQTTLLKTDSVALQLQTISSKMRCRQNSSTASASCCCCCCCQCCSQDQQCQDQDRDQQHTHIHITALCPGLPG